MASSMAVWRAIDLVLRVIYVVAVPILLVPLAVLFPLTGTFVGAGIATVVALIGSDRWHAAVGRIPLVGRALWGMTALGDFYREHPPKPLVYYIFYPVLLPVILFLRIPRREFLLYRGINSISAVVVAITGIWDYVHNWYPEVSFGTFLGIGIVAFVLQLLAIFSVVMPIVTTLVMLRMRDRTKTLSAVILGIGIAAVLGLFASHHLKSTLSLSTWMRIEERTKIGLVEFRRCNAAHDGRNCASANKAFVAMVRALDEVYIVLKDHPDDRDTALEHGREQIRAYYKPDEAAQFQLYVGEGIYMLYVVSSKRHSVWLARDTRQLITEPAKLPPGARQLLLLD